jgi:hypothetical protein
MNRKFFICFLFFLCYIIHGFSQDLTCNDFKEGVFVSSIDKPLKMEWEITRKGNFQVERIKSFPKGIDSIGKSKVINAKIKWINDCSYNLIFDASKRELDNVSKVINDNGGVLAEVIKIEGRCFYYKSSMKINGEDVILSGKLCKKE